MAQPAAQAMNPTQQFLTSIAEMHTKMRDQIEGNLDKSFKNHINAMCAEILTEITALGARLEVLEKASAGVKARTKTKGEKAAGEPAKAEGDAAAAAATPEKAAEETGAKTGVKNKMLWFKDQYKVDAFRADLMAEMKKVMPNFEETMNNDKSVADKKDAAKNTARASFIWKFIGSTPGCKEYLAKITAQHEEYKKEQDRKNKPAQNNAEAATPSK